MLIPLVHSLYIYKQESLNLFISKEAFQRYKEDIHNEANSIDTELNTIQETEPIFTDLKNSLSNFYNNYSEDLITDWNDTKKNNENEIIKIENQITDNNESIKKLKTKIQQTETDILKLNESLNELNNKKNNLLRFIPLFELLPVKNNEKDKIETTLFNKNNEIKNYDNKIKENYSTINNIKNEIQQLNNEIILLNNDYTEYGLKETVYNDETFQDSTYTSQRYDKIKSNINAIQSKLQNKYLEINSIKEILSTLNTQFNRIKKELDNSSHDYEWFENNQRIITDIEIIETNKTIQKLKTELEKLQKKCNDINIKKSTAESLYQEKVNDLKEKYSKENYYEYSKYEHKEEYSIINDKLKKIKLSIKEVENLITEKINYIKDTKNAIDILTDTNLSDRQLLNINNYSADELSKFGNNLIFISKSANKNYAENEKATQNKNIELNKSFETYFKEASSMENPTINDHLKQIQMAHSNDKLNNYKTLNEKFNIIFKGMEESENIYYRELAESEKEMKIFSERSLQKTKIVYDKIMEMPKNTKINLYDKEIQMLKINWHTNPDDENLKKVYNYFEKVMNDLHKAKLNNISDDEIEKRIQNQITIPKLLDVIAPFDNCRVSVFKPQNEAIINNSISKYYEWNEINKWSQGEKYCVYFLMYMNIITHIRYIIDGISDLSKVIIADNPFGKASSSHIVDIVFNASKSNNIQLVCFTDIRIDNILKKFPYINSLKFRQGNSCSILQNETVNTNPSIIENGLYKNRK